MVDRMDRVNSEVQAITSQFLNSHRDQFLPNILTVTNAEVSRDLQHAKIWISIIGKHINKTDLQNKLEHLRRNLQSEINRKLAFKFTPIVEFVLDKSGEYAEKIDQILKNLSR
jgi:ribosome-binding factor A